MVVLLVAIMATVRRPMGSTIVQGKNPLEKIQQRTEKTTTGLPAAGKKRELRPASSGIISGAMSDNCCIAQLVKVEYRARWAVHG